MFSHCYANIFPACSDSTCLDRRQLSRDLAVSLGGDLLGRSAHWSGGRTPGGVTLPNPSYSQKKTPASDFQDISVSFEVAFKQQLILFL